MKKLRQTLLAGLLVGLLAGPQYNVALGAASGTYTDLLPIGAAADTTVISRGSGWAVTTLPPTSTFGDSLSRLVDTIYQSTGAATINATTTASTFTALSQGNVGYATFPAGWVASGRSIETIVDGTYSTNNPGPNWTWAVKLGTTTILNTGAVASPGGQTTQYFKARSVMTIAATGASGSVMGTYEILVASGATSVGAGVVSFSTTTSNTTTVDLTSQLTINPVFTWGTANSSMTVRNVSIRLLN